MSYVKIQLGDMVYFIMADLDKGNLDVASHLSLMGHSTVAINIYRNKVEKCKLYVLEDLFTKFLIDNK